MPAKPLTEEQLRDASRLRAAYELWVSSRKELGLPTSQDEVANLFGINQSALSQYLNGKIPLGPDALRRFADVLRVHPANISPGVVREQRALADALETGPAILDGDEKLPPSSKRRHAA